MPTMNEDEAKLFDADIAILEKTVKDFNEELCHFKKKYSEKAEIRAYVPVFDGDAQGLRLVVSSLHAQIGFEDDH